MRMIAKLGMVMLLTALLAVALVPKAEVAYAAKSAKQSKIVRNRAIRDRLWEKVKNLSVNQTKLDVTITMLDERENAKDLEISKIESQYDQASDRRDKLQAKGKELEQRLSQSKEALSERAKAIYMQGELSYVDLLFQSASFSELIDRMFFVQAIFENDEKLINDTKDNQNQLTSQMSKINEQISAINEIKTKLEVERGELQEIKGEKELTMQAIEKDKKLVLRQIEELEAENKRIAAQLRAASRSATAFRGKPWSGSFLKPCPGPITSGFGMRFHPILHYNRMHTGVDISAGRGTAIMAAGNGIVYFAGRMGGYGNCVIVNHGNNRATLYGHMNRNTCTKGESVTTKTKLGEVGSTGFSTGNHLHFEVRINGDPVDPLRSLN
jgi:murein DD-endopeptidase MepM/ murein hydrolase activator NlpD